MSKKQDKAKATNATAVQEMVAATESGARNPTAAIPKFILFFIPLAWTIFQLWYASPLPFIFNIFVLNDTEARAIHLAFAIFLGFAAYPTLKSSPRDYIPLQDWLVALLSSFCAAYLWFFYVELSDRPGDPTTFDLVVAVIGAVALLEATRRALGPPLMIVAMVFIVYTFGGPLMPDIIAHKGASFSKGMYHYWLSTEGVFGVALGVSTGMVFMFVLFGALLESAGAGNYFIRAAFAGLGHLRGGPAKAAVVASGLTGLVSGSSIANVVTTGTFTIPLMKKVGFKPEKAGAIEVACSTNGQLMPPVMGAAAFLMVEYVGITYIEVIKHAFLPAVISYIALVYIVHLEALKLGLKGLEKQTVAKSLLAKLLSFVMVFLFMIIMGGVTYYGLGWIKALTGGAAIYVVAVLVFIAYVLLVAFACKVPELDDGIEIDTLPQLGPTLQTGYYFLLPIVVLMWCLVVERLSPSLSAYWSTVLLIFIVITQRPLKGFFRKAKGEEFTFMRGLKDMINGFVAGARNMVVIGVATSAAGIVVGTVTLTGIGLVMTEFVELVSGGNLMLILFFTAIISLILGMGLPTTANYIVVSTLMAPVIVNLGAQNGLVVPLVAVHLFVFYFGILADDTPPVGLAAFAAAGISGGDPIRTGIQGFTYDIRTAILPFMFIFNTELLMVGVANWLHLLIVIVVAIAGMMVFAAGTQGYFIVKNRIWETAALLLIAFTLFRPGFWWDMVYPPVSQEPPSKLIQLVEKMDPGSLLRIELKGENLDDGSEFTKTVMLPVGNEETGPQRIAAIGFETQDKDGKIVIDNIVFSSPAEKAGLDFDQEIISIEVPSDRLPKQVMIIPAFALLALIGFAQRRRKILTA